MKKITLALLLFLSPTLAYAGEQVVILKKDCYSLKFRIICKGTVKNISNADVKEVGITLYNDGSLGYDFINYLPAKENMEFTIEIYPLHPGKLFLERLEQLHDVGLTTKITYKPVD